MKRRRKRSSRIPRWLLILMIIALPLFYLGKRVYKLVDSMLEEKSLKKKIVILQAENEVLRQRINEYKKGSLIETRARDNLGMIKQGEKIYLIHKK